MFVYTLVAIFYCPWSMSTPRFWHLYAYVYIYIHCMLYKLAALNHYGVASISRIDKIIGLLCKRALLKRLYSAKETCNLIDPTDRSHPIYVVIVCPWSISNPKFLLVFSYVYILVYVYPYVYMLIYKYVCTSYKLTAMYHCPWPISIPRFCCPCPTRWHAVIDPSDLKNPNATTPYSQMYG